MRNWVSVCFSSIFLYFYLSVGGVKAEAVQVSPEAIWSNDEVIVTAPYKGPALWRVVKADRIVWILGLLPMTTANPEFDQNRLDRLLAGAEAVYLPPSASGGLGTLFKYMTSKGLPQDQTLKDVTTDKDYQRFLSLSQTHQLKSSDYVHDKAVWAAMRFRTDVYKKSGYAYYGITRAVLDLAKLHKVKVLTIGQYKAGSLIDSLSQVSETEGRACFGSILDDIDFTNKNIDQMTQLWASGNVRALKSVVSAEPEVSCIDAALSETRLKKRSGQDTIRVIEAAMKTVKHSVILLPIEGLIGDSDLLEGLRSQGYNVLLPNALRD